MTRSLTGKEILELMLALYFAGKITNFSEYRFCTGNSCINVSCLEGDCPDLIPFYFEMRDFIYQEPIQLKDNKQTQEYLECLNSAILRRSFPSLLGNLPFLFNWAYKEIQDRNKLPTISNITKMITYAPEKYLYDEQFQTFVDEEIMKNLNKLKEQHTVPPQHLNFIKIFNIPPIISDVILDNLENKYGHDGITASIIFTDLELRYIAYKAADHPLSKNIKEKLRKYSVEQLEDIFMYILFYSLEHPIRYIVGEKLATEWLRDLNRVKSFILKAAENFNTNKIEIIKRMFETIQNNTEGSPYHYLLIMTVLNEVSEGEISTNFADYAFEGYIDYLLSHIDLLTLRSVIRTGIQNALKVRGLGITTISRAVLNTLYRKNLLRRDEDLPNKMNTPKRIAEGVYKIVESRLSQHAEYDTHDEIVL